MKYIKKFTESNLGDDPKDFVQMVFDEDEFKEEFQGLELVPFNKLENKWVYDVAGLTYDIGIVIRKSYGQKGFRYDDVYDYLKEKVNFLKDNNIEIVYQIFDPYGYEIQNRGYKKFILPKELYLPNKKRTQPVKHNADGVNPLLSYITIYFNQS